jgi:hypothetical protein
VLEVLIDIRMESLKGKFGVKPTRSRHCEEESFTSNAPTVLPVKWEGGEVL